MKMRSIKERKAKLRTIKYRGKDKANGKWLYGNLIVPLMDRTISRHYIQGYNYSQDEQHEVDGNTVGLFSGHFDKNGVDIYEGDIFHVGDPNITYTVVWVDTGLKGKQNGSSSYVGIEHWADVSVVIGNVHDNVRAFKKGESNESL